MKVYLCGPLDLALLDHCVKWREFARLELDDMDCIGIDPVRGDNHPSPNDTGDLSTIPTQPKPLVARDMRDVSRCDIVLCYWPADATKRGIGTLMEIALAMLWHKPVLLIDPGKQITHHPWIEVAVTEHHDTLLSALNSIDTYWR